MWHFILPTLLTLAASAANAVPRPASILPPVYMEIPHDEDGTFHMVTPLYWSDEDRGGGYSLLAPLYYHGEDREAESSLTIIPPLFTGLYRAPGSSFTLAGTYVSRQRVNDYWRVLAPLYAGWGDARQETEFLLPIGWRWREGQQEEWYAPPLLSFHAERPGHRAGMRGLLYGYWDDARWERSWLIPLYAHGAQAGTGDEFTWTLLSYTEHNGSMSRGYYGLYYFKDAPGLEVDGVLPLYYSERNGDERTRMLFPLWFEQSQAGTGHSVFFPLYWSAFTPRAESTLVIPFVYYRRNGEDSWWITPLGYAASSNGESSGWIGLYGWSDDRAGEGYSLLAPLYFEWHTPGGTTETVLGLWWDDRDEDGRFSAIAPLYWDYEGEEYALTVLFPYYRYRTADGLDQQGVPLVFETVTTPQYDQWDVLGGLLGRRAYAGGRTEWQVAWTGY